MIDKALRASTNAVFRFVVTIDGIPHGVFTECTLPTIEWETEEVKEGGLNTYTHQLPGRRKGAKITLKKGVGISALLDWYLDGMGETFKRRPVTITLLNSLSAPILAWHIEDAYPVKWSGPQLKADDNSIAIQTLELACGEISVAR